MDLSLRPLRYLFPRLLEADPSSHTLKQLPPYLVNALAHNKAQIAIYYTRQKPSESPDPVWRGAQFALPAIVDVVLSQ